MEITYKQGSEFIGHEFKRILIETEYEITAKTSTLGNPTSNSILEQIQQVQDNLVRNFNIKETYATKYYPWLVILAAAVSLNKK